ncbi:MAG: flagellar basal body rod protein FlgB [Candidatus Electryonea clarkiae]|nr:flagellar basal body rod protein FlgB [Candidatus Electryonea clarkiae]
MLREVLYNNTSVPILKRGIDAFADRQRAIASNIANIEVKGYERKTVVFEELLKQAFGDKAAGLSASRQNHIPIQMDPKEVRHMIKISNDDSESSGVNDVDIEREMSDLATNQIQYDLTARKLKGYFNKIKKLARS